MAADPRLAGRGAGSLSAALATRRQRWLAALALLAILGAEILFRAGVLAPLDQRLHDLAFQWQGARYRPSEVAIVAIDEATLAAYPDDPLVFWTDRLAQASATLRQIGVRAIGVDLLLSSSPERWLGKLAGQSGELRAAAREYDRAFREEIHSGQLVLAATRTGSGAAESDYLLPSPDYLLALPDFDVAGYVGLGDLLDEGDGVVRRFRASPVAGARAKAAPGETGMPDLGLPTLLALRARQLDPQAPQWTLAGFELRRESPPELIPFAGPPGSFPTLSLHRLLQPGARNDPAVQALAGRVVLLGVTAAGLNDEHFTPYSSKLFAGGGTLMTGLEIHANVVEALLAGERLRVVGEASRLLAMVAVTLLSTLLFAAARAWLGGVLWLGIAGLAVVFVLALFHVEVLFPASVLWSGPAFALLGVLGYRLSGEERERARVRQMFGRYVSGQVVEALLAAGERPQLSGSTQTITVLFADIRSFTTISERLDAREAVEMLNTYFERACEPLLAEGGSIDKFIGDAIMVEFGMPLPCADHAARALRAAVALHRVAQEFAQWMQVRFPGRELPPFAIGIGLHSGEAVVGDIGSASVRNFTAIGDTVNLASRLEGMTKELGCAILASEATLALAGDIVRCGRSEVVRVRGRAAPVKVFEVLGIRAQGDGHA